MPIQSLHCRALLKPHFSPLHPAMYIRSSVTAYHVRTSQSKVPMHPTMQRCELEPELASNVACAIYTAEVGLVTSGRCSWGPWWVSTTLPATLMTCHGQLPGCTRPPLTLLTSQMPSTGMVGMSMARCAPCLASLSAMHASWGHRSSECMHAHIKGQMNIVHPIPASADDRS